MERGTAALAQDLEQLRQQQQTQEKDALALDHEQRKLAEEFARAGSRLSIARLELERLAREDQRAADAARRQPTCGRREGTGPLRSGESPGRDSWGVLSVLQAHAHAVGEEHAALRADLAGLRNGCGRSARRRRGWTRRSGNWPRAARIWRASWSAWAWTAPGCWPITSSWISAPQAGGGDRRRRPQVEQLAAERSRTAEPALAGLEESLKTLRIEAQAAQERRARSSWSWSKKQGDLKYLDETSRKELSVRGGGGRRGRRAALDEAARGGSRAALSGSARARSRRWVR